jgi:predicted nucleotidyltransferase component of viral defense system
MSPKRQATNIGASVRARIRDLARKRGVEFQLVLSEYAIERLLYRLGASPHAERFVLKGATLFKLWSGDTRRATWDLDLLGRGAGGVDDTIVIVRELCAINVNDGIVFAPESITGEIIRVPDEDAGVRLRMEASLDAARIPMQIDIGFGDAVVPAPKLETYPVLLDHDPPRILVYPREAVVAEKFEAMVSLGVANSRMKDFYDVHRLASLSTFDGETLVRALRATFVRRDTPFPTGEPLALTSQFWKVPERSAQWRAFLRRGRLKGPSNAEDLIADLRTFLLPVLRGAAEGVAFPPTWHPGGLWTMHEQGVR